MLKHIFLAEKSEVEIFRSALSDLLPKGRLAKDEYVQEQIDIIKQLYAKGVSPFEYFFELHKKKYDKKKKLLSQPVK
jgi:hypothetical protein